MPDNHTMLSLFGRLSQALHKEQAPRGYVLEHDGTSYVITGDFSQFYLDVVAADAGAHLVADFLKVAERPIYDELDEMARDDGIDLDFSQETFMRALPLSAHLEELGV